MSEIAVHPVDGSPGPTQLMTWRDAVTPLSRSSRRRWTVAYALLLLLGGLLVAAPETVVSLWRADAGTGDVARDTAGNGWLPLLVALLIVFGMLRRGTRRLTAVDHPLLDERDLVARDRAFRLAYPLLLAVLALTAVALLMVLPDIERTEVLSKTRNYAASSVDDGSFLTSEAVLGLVLWGGLWAVFLPTGILAWNEPDSLSTGPAWSPAGLSEPLRDALVGVSAAGALILPSVGWDGTLSLLPLIAVLTLLGALARRAAGQRPISPAMVWALGAVVAVVALGLIAYVLLVAV